MGGIHNDHHHWQITNALRQLKRNGVLSYTNVASSFVVQFGFLGPRGAMRRLVVMRLFHRIHLACWFIIHLKVDSFTIVDPVIGVVLDICKHFLDQFRVYK